MTSLIGLKASDKDDRMHPDPMRIQLRKKRWSVADKKEHRMAAPDTPKERADPVSSEAAGDGAVSEP